METSNKILEFIVDSRENVCFNQHSNVPGKSDYVGAIGPYMFFHFSLYGSCAERPFSWLQKISLLAFIR